MESRFKPELGLSALKMEDIEKGIARILEQKQKESDDKIAKLQDQVVKFTLKEEKMKKIVEKLLLAVQAQQDTISELRREMDEINKRLGLNEIMAFDLNAACSGFLYALNVADKMLKSGAYKNALVVGAETLTRLTDWSDRNTCVLFGDAAGAIVLSTSDKDHVKDVICGSISDDQGYLMCKNPDLKVPEVNAISKQDHIHMNGREVFKFATRIMPKMINELLERNNLEKDDINYVVAHQANERIIDKASRDVEIGMDRMFLNIHKYGNTSAASVPLALDEAIKEGKLKKGDLFITVAFGGGFSYGGALIEL